MKSQEAVAVWQARRTNVCLSVCRSPAQAGQVQTAILTAALLGASTDETQDSNNAQRAGRVRNICVQQQRSGAQCYSVSPWLIAV